MAALTEEINGLQSSMHPRWARFAQFLADGATQAQAAIDAGFALAGARQQGNRLAGEPVIAMLVEKLQMLDAISASAIRRPALRRVLMGVMEGGVHADQVAAVRVAMKLEGYDRTRIEVTGLAPAKSAEELRKDLAERMVRQREAKS